MENQIFMKGVNLGGWLSQYDVNEPKPFTEDEKQEHFLSFIKEDDFARIAGWGADHVRVPFAAWIIEDQNYPYDIHVNGFYYLDKAIEWCQKYKLNIIIDLHEFFGHLYGRMDEVIPLLSNSLLQDRFIKLWECVVARYVNIKKPYIMYELLNEISDASGGYLWRSLYTRTISAIRKIDKDCLILVGCNNQNSVFDIGSLQILPDNNIWYNFHYYEPQVFTHQKAHFSEDMVKYNTVINYPGMIEGFKRFLEENPKYRDKYRWMAIEKTNDRALLEKTFINATNFVQYSGRKLYCGEFGVINSVRKQDKARYVSDVCSMLSDAGIGYAYWNYKEMDFGLVNRQGEIIDPDVVNILFNGDSATLKE